MDLSTITNPIRVTVESSILRLCDHIDDFWIKIGLDRHTKIKEGLFKGPLYYMTPGNPGIQIIQSGPYGRGPLALVGDLISFINDQLILERVLILVVSLNKLTGIE